MQSRYLAGVLALAAFALGFPLAAQATAVGRFVQVEGSVDLMKGGKSPAVPVKVQDEVQQGDAIRTKSQSRAQIQFVDDTVLTLAPESRVAIDEYTYDASKSKRQATVEVFRGMVHFLVSKILQTEKPDFVMKTHTGVLGVRGTGWYAQLTPLSTDIYNEHGTTQVQNLFPEVPGIVTLTGLEFTRVVFNLPPSLPMPITQQDLLQLKVFFSHFNGGGGAASPLATGPLAGGGGPGTLLGTLFTLNNEVNNPANNPTFTVYTANTGLNNPNNNPLIPPAPTPMPMPMPTIFNFTETFTEGPYSLISVTPFTVGSFASTGTTTVTRVGVYPGIFTAVYSFSTTWTNPELTWTSIYNGFFNATMAGQVSGTLGGNLTGTMTMTLVDPVSGNFSLSGQATLNPSGALTFTFNGTGQDNEGDTIVVSLGNLTQPDPPATGTEAATTNGAWAHGTFLSSRFTRLTGTSLGSRIQGMSNLTQTGTAGNPALAANLRAFRRLRQQQRLAALQAASGPTPGGRSSGNPAGPILASQRH